MNILYVIDMTFTVMALICFVISCIMSDDLDYWFKIGTICLLAGIIAGHFA